MYSFHKCLLTSGVILVLLWERDLSPEQGLADTVETRLLYILEYFFFHIVS